MGLTIISQTTNFELSFFWTTFHLIGCPIGRKSLALVLVDTFVCLPRVTYSLNGSFSFAFAGHEIEAQYWYELSNHLSNPSNCFRTDRTWS